MKNYINNQPKIIYVLQSTGIAGGIRVVFEHVNRLNSFGIPSEVYALQGFPNWVGTHARVKSFPDYEKLSVDLNTRKCIKVATFWKTASTVARSSAGSEICYLVQDIEKLYYEDVKTQNDVVKTYNLPFRFLVESKWVEEQLVLMGKIPNFIGIGINHDVYKVLPYITRKQNVILINAPRRGVHWIIKGMDILYKVLKKVIVLKPGIEIISFSKERYGFDLPSYCYTHYSSLPDREIVELYNTATCFLTCSKHEGFCLPALEAMACGCPVVATNAGGNEEFCIHNQSCLVVEGKVDNIIGTILNLLPNKNLIKKLRVGGIDISKKYKWDKVISLLIESLNL